MPGPTRAPKAIQAVDSNANRNLIDKLPSPGPSSEPIIIDLLPYSSPSTPSWDASSTLTTKKYTEASTTASTRPGTTPIVTTGAPVVITAKPATTAKPKTTTAPAPGGLGVSLWQALFGTGNLLQATTTASTKNAKPAIKTVTVKPPVKVTQKPTQAVKSTTYANQILSATPIRSHTTPRSVEYLSDIQASPTESFVTNISSASVPISSTISTTSQTPSTISSTSQTLLNNPNPRLNDVPTSTYSPEDDAKFLSALLRAIQTGKSRYFYS